MKGRAYGKLELISSLILFILLACPLKLFDFISPQISSFALSFIKGNLEVYLLILLSPILLQIIIYISRRAIGLNKDEDKLKALEMQTLAYKSENDKSIHKIQQRLIILQNKLYLQEEKIKSETKMLQDTYNLKTEKITHYYIVACDYSSKLDKDFAEYTQIVFRHPQVAHLSNSILNIISKISDLKPYL